MINLPRILPIALHLVIYFIDHCDKIVYLYLDLNRAFIFIAVSYWQNV